MSKCNVILPYVAALLMLGPGCSRIEEPWVQDQSQYQQERARSAAMADRLDHRLRYTQRDR
jgi:hypothetical protein